jgi:hypothetical protein
MAVANSMCSTCRRPIFLGAPASPRYAELAHLKCLEAPRSVNAWPGGSRHVACLGCGRDFESDSKAQRLCRSCRSSGVKPH